MIHLNMSFFVNPRQGQMLNGISDSVQLHACSATGSHGDKRQIQYDIPPVVAAPTRPTPRYSLA